MSGKSLGMMSGWWKYMRVIDLHGLGPIGAFEKRRRKSKFYFF